MIKSTYLLPPVLVDNHLNFRQVDLIPCLNVLKSFNYSQSWSLIMSLRYAFKHCEFSRSHVDLSMKHSSPSCHGVPQIVNYDWIMVRIEMENGEHSVAQINFREGFSMNFPDCDRDVVNNTRRVIFWEMSPFESYKKLAWGLCRTFSTIINSPRIEMIVKTQFQRAFAT